MFAVNKRERLDDIKDMIESKGSEIEKESKFDPVTWRPHLPSWKKDPKALRYLKCLNTYFKLFTLNKDHSK